MARSAEILITGDESVIGTALLREAGPAGERLGMKIRVTKSYRGDSDWLCLWGVGAEERDKARKAHITSGGNVACWDLGYIGAGKIPRESYLRVSINHNHPWRMMDATPSMSSRLDRFGLTLREDCNPDGPVIVIGMGPKSRAHLNNYDWEIKALTAAQQRFPEAQVLYRPKPRKVGDKHIDWPQASNGPIDDAIRGARLVICRHSNVAVDACIAGVPAECEDGAAYWLYRNGSNPSRESRLSFLRKLAFWQYRTDEQEEAWTFLDQMVCA